MEAISKISHCTSLRSLKVNVDSSTNFSEVFEDSAWCRFLEFLDVSPPSVSRITIEYDDPFDHFYSRCRNMEWSRLDEILCQKRKLEFVAFTFWEREIKAYPQEAAASVTFLRNSLPRTQSSGVEICVLKR